MYTITQYASITIKSNDDGDDDDDDDDLDDFDYGDDDDYDANGSVEN